MKSHSQRNLVEQQDEYDSQGMLKRRNKDAYENAKMADDISGIVKAHEKAQEVFEKVEKACFKKDVSRFSQVLLTLSVVSSFMFWTSLVLPLSGYLHMAVKWLSVATLTCIAVRFLSCKQDFFLFAALFFHGLGDLVLAHPYQDYLLYSLGPFLLGHIFYILTFKADVTDYQRIKRNLSRAKKIIISSMLIYSCLLAAVLVPRLFSTPFLVPLVVYIIIVTIMVVLSVIPSYTTRWIVVGACLYVLSDSLIALNKFYLPLPYPLNHLTWPLYYIGQIMIMFGFLKEKNKAKNYFFISHPLFSF